MTGKGRSGPGRVSSVNPDGLPPPRGYSHGMLGRGRVLFVAGQIGWNEHAQMVSARFADQFDQALANVLTVVTAAGGSVESIGRLTIYVVDRSEYAAAQKELGARYRMRMGGHYPAMTLVEVKALLEDGAKVEIEATAVIPD
jgi:enamine deaminase RidA (YjgF/YER057c/UK114 family)